MNIRTLAIACLAGAGLLATAHHSEAATATLAWTHPADEHVSGYVISYGTESGKYPQRVKLGFVTSASISGLSDLITYYFIVQSYNPNGTLGAPSAELRVGAGLPIAIACPSPVLTSPDGKAMAVTLLPTVSGGTAPVTTTCSPASGSLFAVGSTSFSCTAVDATLQKASCTSTVVVLAAVVPPPPPPSPSIPPLTISCPVIAPVTETGGGKAKVDFAMPIVSGGVSPAAVQCTPKSGSQFSVGTTAIACTATDAAKNTASCSTSVTVLSKESKGPSITPKDPNAKEPTPKK